jgi:hypothetical protein
MSTTVTVFAFDEGQGLCDDDPLVSDADKRYSKFRPLIPVVLQAAE